jgi:ribosomal protein S18 acetylase RimI-like enzyme
MRRLGIGRKLMSFAENRTARLAPNFYLCVSSFNRQAQAFYRDLGYSRVGKIPGLISPDASEYIFWKSLV